MTSTRSTLKAALVSLDATRAQIDPLKDLREWRLAQQRNRLMAIEQKATVTLKQTPDSRIPGFDYEVSQGGVHLCYGWAAGTRAEARVEALEHASRALRIREQIRASAITGERAGGDR